jgi:hypothetical protein
VKKTSQALLHITGCIFFLMMPVIFSPDFMGDRPLFSIPPFKRDLMAYVMLLAFFYLNFYVLVPRFYFTRKYLIFGLSVLACFLFIAIVPDMLFEQEAFRAGMHNGPPPGHFRPPPHRFPILREIYHYLFPFLIVLVLSLLFCVYSRWRLAEKERANAELSYLKAQINPHFLFNTLNTIYSLAIKNSPNTAEAVLKLSGMMRYVLTEGNNQFVPLEKEIGYISDYIELQRIRVQRSVRLSYQVSGGFTGRRIAPILLIPFIENAFKYGVNAEENSAIDIRITTEGDVLHLAVENNKVSLGSTLKEPKSGLGIENTRERLQLLYPGAHTLEIEDGKEKFKVNLTLALK